MLQCKYQTPKGVQSVVEKFKFMNDQVTREETAELLRLAEQALSTPGDFVELGCYRGDTSVLLGQLIQKLWKSCGKLVEKSLSKVENSQPSVENKPKTVENQPVPCAKPVDNSVEKHLWIYDSFAGLPAKTVEDSSGAGANFKEGELLVTKREVVEKLRKHGLRTSSHPDSTQPNVIIKKAWFDQLQDADLPQDIAYAFLDGDLYSSIKTSLQLVVPRLSQQGIIIVHDYNNPELPGSARAVDEFLRTHADWQLQVRHSLAILRHKC